MRPINADSLKESIKTSDLPTITKMAMLLLVSDEPTIEVETPKQGKWRYKTLDDYICSCCGFVWDRCGKFCPNCGAKMRT